MTPPTFPTLTQHAAAAVAAAAVKELVNLKYNNVERWQTIFGEKLPVQARRDCEKRALLLAAVTVLEESIEVVK